MAWDEMGEQDRAGNLSDFLFVMAVAQHAEARVINDHLAGMKRLSE